MLDQIAHTMTSSTPGVDTIVAPQYYWTATSIHKLINLRWCTILLERSRKERRQGHKAKHLSLVIWRAHSTRSAKVTSLIDESSETTRLSMPAQGSSGS